jgi:hypothetical protein
MENRRYKAYVVREKEDGSFFGEVTDKNIDDLPPAKFWYALNFQA